MKLGYLLLIDDFLDDFSILIVQKDECWNAKALLSSPILEKQPMLIEHDLWPYGEA